MTKSAADGAPIIIKKYANRRLYNTGSSSYITLDNLAQMVREQVDFKVVDAKSGDDITHAILTQIIVEEEASSTEQMLPVSFLRDLIAMYGNSMQTMMPAYLEASMANFRQNQQKMREAFDRQIGANPFAKLAETNMAMMRAATQAFMPGQSVGAAAPKAQEDATPSSEIDALKAEMAALQKRFDALEN